jgi:hypothetical protein
VICFKHRDAAERYHAQLTGAALAGVRISENTTSSWQARVRLQGFPDTTKTFTSRKAAEEWARAQEGEMTQRQAVYHRVADRTCRAELLVAYQEKHLAGRDAAHPDRSRIRTLAKLPFAQIRMSALQPKDVAGYRDSRLLHVKGATVRKELELMTRVINIARQEGGLKLALNPAAGSLVRRPKPEFGDERDRRLRELHSACPIVLEPASGRRGGAAASRETQTIDFARCALDSAMTVKSG